MSFMDTLKSWFTKGKELADEAAQKAGPVLEKARENLSEAVEKAKPVIEQAVEKAKPVIEQAKEKASEAWEKGKEAFEERRHEAGSTAATSTEGTSPASEAPIDAKDTPTSEG